MRILDMTAGNRMMWYQKNKNRSDVVYYKGDFTKRVFNENWFDLVIYDPPHIIGKHFKDGYEESYGHLGEDWEKVLKKGFDECMRVLKHNGILIFKWSEVSVSGIKVLKVLGQDPLFGQNTWETKTKWWCFIKE